MAAYCVLQGIDYIVEECPMATGNRHIAYKEALNAIEDGSPGTKNAFYFGFVERVAQHFVGEAAEEQEGLRACIECGSATTTETCAFCRLSELARRA